MHEARSGAPNAAVDMDGACYISIWKSLCAQSRMNEARSGESDAPMDSAILRAMTDL